MQIDTSRMGRPKGRSDVYRCRVTEGERVVFDDAWVAIKFPTERSSRRFAQLICELHRAGCSIPRSTTAKWIGNLGDDCTAAIGEFTAHAEHLEGPATGGRWYCTVGRKDDMRDCAFHSMRYGVHLRSGKAARWLCEVVAAALEIGIQIEED